MMPPDRPHNSARREHPTPTHILKTSSSNVLPLHLRGVVPDCAQSCLSTYISEEYNCPRYGTTCLCQNYSSHGFTLGELAYICLHQDCNDTSRTESLAQYNICSTVSGAVSATHSVLTLPATTSTKPFTSTTTKTNPSLRTTTTHFTSSNSGLKPHSQLHHSISVHSAGSSATVVSKATAGRGDTATMQSSTSDTAYGSSATPPVTAAATSPSSTHSARLTAPQAAGISIAVLAITILIIAFIYFFVCFRRQKTKREDPQESDGFVEKAPPILSPMLPKRQTDNMGRVGRDTIRCWEQLENSPAQQRERNVDVSPESAQSYESTRTVSRLFQNKSAAPPPRPSVKSRSGSADTAGTEFEEDITPPAPVWKGVGLPASPQALKYPQVKIQGQTEQTSAASSTVNLPTVQHLPPLSLEMPKSATRSPPVRPPPPVLRPPLLNPMENPGESQPRRSAVSRSRSRDSSVSLLNYYASSEAGVSTSPVLADSPVAMELEAPKLPIPSDFVITKAAEPRSVNRKDSAASDTSFESMELGEPTPPEEEDKQLTPVQESPVAQRSPIADIRYPKIPRSANQTVPRSPVYGALSRSSLQLQTDPQSRHGRRKIHPVSSPKQNQQKDRAFEDNVTPDRQINPEPALSGSTLAAKRRGESAAHNLELKLNTEESAYASFNKFNSSSQHADRYGSGDPHSLRQESPLRGYGRVASSGRKQSHSQHHSRRKSPGRRGPQEVTLKSPLWEPKLTPQKRGDDLYLQVGVATPMNANFQQ